jgi:two-component system alkaline phosphatase synthesis response regulator PhoP
MAELLARITALLRRAAHQPAAPSREENGIHEFGDIKVNVRRGEVQKGGQPVVMSAREFQLLRYLIEHPGSVVSRETLLHEVWGYQATPSTRTVDVHMAWLRQKLENNPKLPEYFLTLRGMGYKFVG